MGRGRPRSTPETFWVRVDRSAGPDACWPWMGAPKDRRREKQGSYGAVWFQGKNRVASRVALELHLGRPLTPGLETLHSCDNPPCCNPAHLSEGTHRRNMEEAKDRGRLDGCTPWTEAQLAAGVRRLAALRKGRPVGRGRKKPGREV